MNKKTTLILVAIMLFVATAVVYQIAQTRKSNQSAETALEQKIQNSELGLSFTYTGGENGFTLVEPPAEQVGILKAYLLLPVKAYEEYKIREIPGEAPAGMNIFVFAMEDTATSSTDSASTGPAVDRLIRLQAWATTNTGITSYTTAKSAPETIEIDGLKMLHYRTDGLYQQDVYLGSYKSRAYMFVGQYNEETDQTFTAFQTLIQTVSFD